MYDVINKKVLEFLSELFPMRCESNPYKSRLKGSNLDIEISHVPKREYYKGTISYRGAQMSNSLPQNLKSAKPRSIFKKEPIGGCQIVTSPLNLSLNFSVIASFDSDSKYFN